MGDWPADPEHDWSKHFAAGDFVRLADGRPAVVRCIQDYAPEPPARWELIVSGVDRGGFPDTFIVEPWSCQPDPSAAQELAHAGIT